jgi:Ring finger domain
LALHQQTKIEKIQKSKVPAKSVKKKKQKKKNKRYQDLERRMMTRQKRRQEATGDGVMVVGEHPTPSPKKVKTSEPALEQSENGNTAGNGNASEASKEGGDDKDECAICLCTVTLRGQLDECNHLFCADCILRWAQESNCCPLCRQRFHAVTKRPYPDTTNMSRASRKRGLSGARDGGSSKRARRGGTSNASATPRETVVVQNTEPSFGQPSPPPGHFSGFLDSVSALRVLLQRLTGANQFANGLDDDDDSDDDDDDDDFHIGSIGFSAFGHHQHHFGGARWFDDSDDSDDSDDDNDDEEPDDEDIEHADEANDRFAYYLGLAARARAQRLQQSRPAPITIDLTDSPAATPATTTTTTTTTTTSTTSTTRRQGMATRRNRNRRAGAGHRPSAVVALDDGDETEDDGAPTTSTAQVNQDDIIVISSDDEGE